MQSYPEMVCSWIGLDSFCLGLAASCVRLFAVSFCTTPWHVFLVTPLQALTMSLAWTAMIEHAWKIFPKEVTISGIGVLATMFWFLPDIFSNLVGSQLYFKYGGPWLFRVTGTIGVVWTVFAIIYFRLTNSPSASLEPGRSEDDDVNIQSYDVGKDNNIDLYGVE